MTSSRPTIVLPTPAGDLAIALSFDRAPNPADRCNGGAGRPDPLPVEPVAHVRFERLVLHRVAYSGRVEVRLGRGAEEAYSYISRVGTFEDPTWQQRAKVAAYVVAAIREQRDRLLCSDEARASREYERAEAIRAAEAEVDRARAALAAAEAKLAAAQAA